MGQLQRGCKVTHQPNPTLSDAEIIGSAYISDNIRKAYPTGLPEELGALIATERLLGNHVVLVYWSTGEFAVMPCMPGTDMPSPENVVRAYHGCLEAARRGQEGA